MASDLKEYRAPDGRTYLLNEQDAKAAGYKPVETKQQKAPANKQAPAPTSK